MGNRRHKMIVFFYYKLLRDCLLHHVYRTNILKVKVKNLFYEFI